MSARPTHAGHPPGRPRVAILSDDLTGANGVAAMFAARGIPARTQLDMSGDPQAHAGTGVLVLDTATRDLGEVAAYQGVHHAVTWLRRAGAVRLAKRIDSTLRGPVGIEIAAVLGALGRRPLAVVVPAAPEAGRVAVGGRVLLDGRPLAEALHVRDDPVDLIREQSAEAVEWLPLAVVRLGPTAIAERVRRVYEHGGRVLVCDAETLADVQVLADGAVASGVPVISVDPGGFTLAMAMAGGLFTSRRRPVEICPVDAGVGALARGRPLAVLGSRASAAHEQAGVAAVRGLLQVVEMNTRSVRAGGGAARREIERVTRRLRAVTRPVAGVRATDMPGGIARSMPSNVRDLSRNPEAKSEEKSNDGGQGRDLTAGSTPATVAAALADVVAGLCAAGGPPAGLYLSGGTVARMVLDRLEVRAVEVEGEVMPLAAIGRLMGGPHAGVRIVTKGGMIGGADAIAACLRALVDTASAPVPVRRA